MSLLNNVLKPIGVLMAAVLVGHCHQACKPVQSPLDGAYAAETVACSTSAKSLSESHRCRANVNQKYGLCPSEVLLCPGDLR